MICRKRCYIKLYPFLIMPVCGILSIFIEFLEIHICFTDGKWRMLDIRFPESAVQSLTLWLDGYIIHLALHTAFPYNIGISIRSSIFHANAKVAPFWCSKVRILRTCLHLLAVRVSLDRENWINFICSRFYLHSNMYRTLYHNLRFEWWYWWVWGN